MAEGKKCMLKVPLIIAAVLVVLRVVLEQLGSPESVNKIFGVAWLIFIIPVYFAFRIAASDEPKPYRALFKNIFKYSVYTRLMVMPTYWLSYALQWSAPRFSLEGGGAVGEGVSPLAGYLGIPLRNLVAWIIGATVIGIIIGGITLATRRRFGAK